MRNYSSFLPQMDVRLGSKPFVHFVPDFSEQKELYRVNDEPINIINNSENVPFIQNVAQQQLVDVSVPGLDTSGLSDEQLANSAIPRYVEVNEIADASRNSLNQLVKEISNVKPSDS